MLDQTMIETIERVRLGHVATVTPGGRPAVSPKGTFVVLDPATLAFGHIRSPGTVQNISHSPEVEVCFVDPFIRKGCRVRASAQVVRWGTDDFAALIPAWVTLWGDLADRISAIVKLNVTAASPLSTPPYDNGVSEQEMVALYKAKYAEIYG
ncbi:MAG: pyridoxamine 5'-phosphate oxidase family protein [Pseudomonadota bacterium]